MRLKQWSAGAVLIVILSIIIALGTQRQVGADPGLGEDGPTAIGEPLQSSVFVVGGDEATLVSGDGTRADAADLDSFTYIPFLVQPGLRREHQAVVDLVNAQRALAGCEPLRISQQLTAAAQGHSADMAVNDFFSHTSSDGSSPWERICATGYELSFGAENIAAGFPTAEAAVNAWMNSSGHRANILNCMLKETGVGFHYLKNDTGSVNYRYYWTQVFATP